MNNFRILKYLLLAIFLSTIHVYYVYKKLQARSYKSFWSHQINDIKVIDRSANETRPLKYEFKSTCACKRNSSVFLEETTDAENRTFYQIYSLNQTTFTNYNLTEQEFQTARITCNKFSTLRRGKHQKVISFCLYGTNRFYYDKLKKLTQLVKKFYSEWTIRVYHDNSIDESIICQLECLDTDNIDFCNINELVLNLNTQRMQTLDAYYVHSMKWRWFPIGDDFVDVFASRDSDSVILQREVDSVNEWMKSHKICHIMRDHPQHFTHILGGMFDFNNERDRNLANHLFALMIDRRVSEVFNANCDSPKNNDQQFLSDYVYPLVVENSLIHDSYLCRSFPGSSPWPTRRLGDCFVGSTGECNESTTLLDYFVCPKKCRPKKHPEWVTC
jgi:hypothetical protein